MAAALSLGRQGLGRTAPNPSVGALIVQDGTVVGIGRTADGGRPHAEVVALAMAGSAARGATLYVTLEPCSHVGRSPPCVDAVLAAGLMRVVVGALDPNPLVAGQGVEALRRAGVEVVVGMREGEARRDLSGHILRMIHGRPHVSLKLAVSADGAIGRRGEGQVMISGPGSRASAHLMRAQHDSIAVGVGTVLADDPALTCRLPGMAGLSPTRVVFDTEARTPPTATLLAGGATILTAPDADGGRVRALHVAGATVVPVPRGEGGRLDLHLALRALARSGVTRLLVEGGAALAEAFAAADLIDAATWIEAPRRVGGDAVRPFGGRGAAALARRLPMRHVGWVGEDRWTQLWRLPCSLASSPTSDAS
ncbi:bifunctional diaminohydroxyphosphoribosylaminopyrimidine deaminase/5-amino-6-(5-phosphoribosylamino)uracil reductase RibD [Acuticoccus sp.]|uniref:bifunctional diaminohydroxyphosphoribosylaminopyrimidine deaminase/5-amino-6-(5-phosphoribosylamino)uracil reductase RibD n=1 Tax=Acuticoccus sp. TaxID=1904378 RepID=UPI003B528D90